MKVSSREILRSWQSLLGLKSLTRFQPLVMEPEHRDGVPHIPGLTNRLGIFKVSFINRADLRGSDADSSNYGTRPYLFRIYIPRRVSPPQPV